MLCTASLRASIRATVRASVRLAGLAMAVTLGLAPRAAQAAWQPPPASAAAPQASSTAPDTIQGRVISDSGRAIVGASVFVTRSSDRAVQQAVTDSSGRFRVTFAEGSGDYLVYASATGHQAARQRVQRTGTERRFDVTLTLKSTAPTQLAAVRVRAQPPAPVPRTVRLGTEEVGGAERWGEGVAGALNPNARGDLAATAATLPGFTAGSGGLSLLGASGALTTLNGAAIPGVQLPRAANLDARFTGTTFDATRGGFSGANFDVRLGPGNRFFQQKNAFLTTEAPAFTVTDAVGRAVGQPAAAARASFGADGELIRQTMSYNVALDASRRVTTPASLLTASAGTLALAGIPGDSVPALRAAAAAAGLPLGIAGAQQVRDNLTLLSRFDDTRDTTRTFAISTLLAVDRRRGLGLRPGAAPTGTAEESDVSGALQLLQQRYYGRDRRLFRETRGSVSWSRQRGSPESPLPAAQVLVGAGTGDPASLGLVALGGDAFAQRDRALTILEGATELSWYPTFSTRHLVRGALWARGDQLRDASLANPWGRVLYQSIADLAAGTPASFTRTLAQPVREAAVLNAAGAVSYRYAPTINFQLLGGARVELNTAAMTPDANPALTQALGVATDRGLTRVHVSPRLGITWRPAGGGQRTGINQSNLGTFLRPSSGTLRLGIGEFRDLLRPEGPAAARAGTGLPDATLGLACVGTAVPAPSWGAWAANPAAIPTSCLGSGSPQALRAPAVTYLDPTFDVARSWRASAGWTQSVGVYLLRFDALAATNLNQPSLADANFAGVTAFTTGDEGRPVFVPASSIAAGTGAVPVAGSRRTQAFGVVRGLRSDGRSDGAQVTASLQLDPFATESNVFWQVAYTLQGVRQRFRGFDGGGVGNPEAFEWARGADDARHTLLAQFGVPFRRRNRTLATLSLFARVQSGLPFTPVVQGDVDGDGTPGDRAFVFDPAADPDPVRAAGMRALLAQGPAWVRTCLDAQRGRMAARQSCEGPWTVSSNMRLELDALDRVLGRRTNVSLNLANPLALADQLLHGEDDLRGWGGPALPDPVLLVPTAFDAGARRFAYRVNPRFGDTRPGRTLLRNPFQLSVDISVNLTRDPDAQALERNIEPVARGAFVRPPADTIVARYVTAVSSIHQSLLDNADTLFLTRDQIEASMRADTVFRREAREIYATLASYLATLPERFNAAEALATVEGAERRYQELFWAQRELVQQRLTPLQKSALPRWIQEYLAVRLEDDWRRWPRYRFRAGSVSISRF